MKKEPITREFAQQKYDTALYNLYLMIALTAVNFILVLVEADYMLLFSASTPYYLAIFGVVAIEEALATFGYVLIGIGIFVILIYLLFAILAKKRFGFMIAALVFFILDTIFMLGMIVLTGEFSGIIDLLVHVWVLYYLIIGVKYGSLLKRLPETVIDVAPEAIQETEVVTENE